MSSKRTETFHTSSSDETKDLGRDVARALARGPRRARAGYAAALALQGDLGAGKTTFVQGFLKGLGSRKRATSPTFILMRRYKLPPRKRFTDVYHVDAYRLRKPEHLTALGMDIILASPKNIALIEWPEQTKRFLPKDAMWVRFKYGRAENERTITIVSPHARAIMKKK